MIITILAFVLLILRFMASYLLIKVVKTQRSLMKRPIDQEITAFRKDLHSLTIALALSNIPAIIMDAFFVLKGLGFTLFTGVTNTSMLVFYTTANALSALLAAVLISRIYRNALVVDKTHAGSDHVLMNDE